MALIKCPECGKEISDRSVSCISCGFPLTNIATDKLAFQQQKTEKENVKTVRQQYGKTKKILINGFTKKARDRDLIQKKKRYEEKSWKLVKYVDVKFGQCYAIFRVPKNENTDFKEIIIGFLGIIFLIWMISLFVGSDDTPRQNNQYISKSTRVQKIKNIEHKIVKTYSDIGSTWKIVVIPKGISKRDLIILAKQLHRKHPKTSFNIFENNNRKKIREYIAAQKHPGNKKYSYPERWLDKHDRGMINKMLVGSVMRWQLYHTYEGKISDL